MGPARAGTASAYPVPVAGAPQARGPGRMPCSGLSVDMQVAHMWGLIELLDHTHPTSEEM
ncbi:hypothetical protein DFJ68_0536 [Terracoccus luteus]|uniref:Uncharacterized protein n=1 Tax=Terracoccus luteus TaxID=53356 RepID=A0A495XRE4_9MICO|nr:hypothetical protein DFJ68_0536 [Terracoccus luteus]